MTCEQARTLLSAYFDRELDVATSLELEAHVGTCERCAAELERFDALRSALAAGPLVFTPPQGLEARVRRAVDREMKPRRVITAAWRWAAVPLAAMLAAGFTWTVAVNRGPSSPQDLMLSELVAGHVRSLMVDHLVDVATSDQHVVMPWFNGKVDFAPPVTDFTANGFPLVGGRMDYIGGRSVAVLVYKHRQHIVNVFIWPSGNPAPHDLEAITYQGYHLVRWEKSGLTFWAISDVNPNDLENLARLIRET